MSDNHANEKSGTLDKVTFIISLLVLAMFVVNSSMVLSNRSLQDDVIAKQSELQAKGNRINQNGTFANINQSLIQALSAAAIVRKDEQIKALLIQNGIDLNKVQQGAAQGAPASAPAAR